MEIEKPLPPSDTTADTRTTTDDISGLPATPFSQCSTPQETPLKEPQSDVWRQPLPERAHQVFEQLTGSRLGPWRMRDENTAIPWRQVFFRLGPLSGILALCLALVCVLASLSVLLGSNQTEVAAWPNPPSTYIAIFTALGNTLMRYAAFQGVITAWWRMALNGSNLRNLHYQWRQGTSLRGAITAGRGIGLLGLACLCSTLVIIDGPLLQRSSTVRSVAFTIDVPLRRTMMPQIPTNYTGTWFPDQGGYPGQFDDTAFNGTIPTPNGPVSNGIFTTFNFGFNEYVKLWQQNSGLMNVVEGCPEGLECTAKLVGPALAPTSCVSRAQTYDFMTPWPAKDEAKFNRGVPFQLLLFLTATELVVDGSNEKINSITGSSEFVGDSCNATFTYNICTLESAIGEYDVSIIGNTTTILSASAPNILAIAKNAPVTRVQNLPGFPQHKSTLGGVVAFHHQRWDAFTYLMNADGQGDYDTFIGGSNTPSSFALPSGHHANGPEGGCTGFSDPRDDYMASINKLMLSYGMAAAQGVGDLTLEDMDPAFQVNTQTIGQAYGQHNVYHTDFRYFAGALIIEIICVALVIPTYWGWWKVGRTVSFSPLEIAKAFEAPMLAEAHSNSPSAAVADRYADRIVQYGVVPVDGDGRKVKLAFADVDRVVRPKQGTLIDV